MKGSIIIMLAIAMVMPGLSFAQPAASDFATGMPKNAVSGNAADSVVKQAFSPIDIKENTYDYYDENYGWGTATQTNYYYQGKLLTSAKDFERVIYPLNDSLANQLLHSAAAKDRWRTATIWSGIVLETAGWTDYAIQMMRPASAWDNQPGKISSAGLNMAGVYAMVLGGVATIVGGCLINFDSSMERIRAAERYNSVVQSKVNLSILYQPTNNAMGLNFTIRI